MIFVSLGSQKFQFNRLLKKLDELVEDGTVREEIFAQIGASDYQPKHYKYSAFLNRDQFADIMKRCSTVVTHGGTGVIVTAVKGGKKVIGVPRLSKYGEHVDDHQLQLLQEFEKQNLIYACYDVENLKDAFEAISKGTFHAYQSNTEVWIKELSRYIDSI